MAERTLDGMLAGEIEDPVDGGFFHYALEADWTRPRSRSSWSINARVLVALRVCRPTSAARTGARRGRAHRRLGRDHPGRDGLWVGSQAADPGYFEADADARRRWRRPPSMTPSTPTPPPCGSPRWRTPGVSGAAGLGGARRRRPGHAPRDHGGTRTDSLVHYRSGPPALRHAPRRPPPRRPRGLAVYRAAGRRTGPRPAPGGHPEDHALGRERRFLRPPLRPHPMGALRYRDRPFEENALAARLLRPGAGDRRAPATGPWPSGSWPSSHPWPAATPSRAPPSPWPSRSSSSSAAANDLCPPGRPDAAPS
jgi:hypothetical protein